MIFNVLKIGPYEQKSLYGVRFPGEAEVRYIHGHDVGLLMTRDNIHVTVTDRTGEDARFYLRPIQILPGLEVLSGPFAGPARGWRRFWNWLRSA